MTREHLFPALFFQSIYLAVAGMIVLAGCGDDTVLITNTGGGDTGTVLKASDFQSAEDCRNCHPKHVEEWEGSMHAYALKDPVFSAVRALGQSAYVNALDQACVQCHSIIGSRTREIPWGPLNFDAMSEPSKEGIGCDLCHTISAISSLSNGGVILTPKGTKYGAIREPEPTSAHESEYHPLYPTSEYCGACHDFVTNGGLELETTFREWREKGFASTGKNCGDCHMPAYTGRAAPNGPERTLHRHTFAGVDVALIDFPHKPTQASLVTDLLRSAVSMDVVVPEMITAGGPLSLRVNITNDKTGHSVPSGVPFNRQMWLSIIARDAGGSILYSSGQLDANDDLMDDHSEFSDRDEDLFNAQATMLRADSLPTGATWEAVYLTNPSIEAGETRAVDYLFDVPAGTQGPLSIEVVLRFRSFAPYLFRSLQLDSLLPIPIIDMAERSTTVAVQ